MNKSARWASRIGLMLAAIVAGILNGSVLAAPILIFMAYLLCILVRQGQQAVTLIEEERLRLAKARSLVVAYNAKYPRVYGGVR